MLLIIVNVVLVVVVVTIIITVIFIELLFSLLLLLSVSARLDMISFSCRKSCNQSKSKNIIGHKNGKKKRIKNT